MIEEITYRLERKRWDNKPDRLIETDPVLHVLLELETSIPLAYSGGLIVIGLSVHAIALDDIQDGISQSISSRGYFHGIFDSHCVHDEFGLLNCGRKRNFEIDKESLQKETMRLS